MEPEREKKDDCGFEIGRNQPKRVEIHHTSSNATQGKSNETVGAQHQNHTKTTKSLNNALRIERSEGHRRKRSRWQRECSGPPLIESARGRSAACTEWIHLVVCRTQMSMLAVGQARGSQGMFLVLQHWYGTLRESQCRCFERQAREIEPPVWKTALHAEERMSEGFVVHDCQGETMIQEHFSSTRRCASGSLWYASSCPTRARGRSQREIQDFGLKERYVKNEERIQRHINSAQRCRREANYTSARHKPRPRHTKRARTS